MDDLNELVLASSDWETLRKLRGQFLSETFSSEKSYWESESLLQLYHLTFAQRIGWKWDSVVEELRKKKCFKNEEVFRVVDYGCGTGIASEKLIAFLGEQRVKTLCLWDRSQKAVDFSGERLSKKFPKVEIVKQKLQGEKNPKTLLLLSHVLNELQPKDVDQILAAMEGAAFVIWVEPGTAQIARRLVEVREGLLKKYLMISPCFHSQACGMKTEKNKNHWCHFFATPPKEIFQSAFWGRWSRELKIDLRSLPLSFLVMKIREEKESDYPETADVNFSRVIGRPRFYKGSGKFLLCRANEVEECSLQERFHREWFSRFKKESFCRSIKLEDPSITKR